MNAKQYRTQVTPANDAAVAARGNEAIGLEQQERRWEASLRTVADGNAPADKRMAATQSLQAATFLGALFEPYMARHIEALNVAAASSDDTLRRFAVSCLRNIGSSVPTAS